MKFLDWCHKNKILVAVFPPHSTHRLQPLDVSLFSPLAKYYSRKLDYHMAYSQGLVSVSKRHFWRFFGLHTIKPLRQIILLVDGKRLESIRSILMLFWAASRNAHVRSPHHLKLDSRQSSHFSLMIGLVCETY
jgi:hypothetical protein